MLQIGILLSESNAHSSLPIFFQDTGGPLLSSNLPLSFAGNVVMSVMFCIILLNSRTQHVLKVFYLIWACIIMPCWICNLLNACIIGLDEEAELPFDFMTL